MAVAYNSKHLFLNDITKGLRVGVGRHCFLNLMFLYVLLRLLSLSDPDHFLLSHFTGVFAMSNVESKLDHCLL